MVENDISRKIIGASIEVHKYLGPGLLESAYSSCLARELTIQGMSYTCEMPLDIIYKGEKIDVGYRLGFCVENRVIIELKSVEKLHQFMMLNYYLICA
jgi:GxxExxY protein